METTWWLALSGVFLLGIQTSISPCPLTTNIAAVSYIGKRVGHSKDVLWSGVFYTLGRTFAYSVLSVLLLLFTMFTGDQLTRFFQTTIHAWLGPILMIIGMLLLEMFSVSLGKANTEKMQKWSERLGLWSALPIGVVFALAFCPTSAATFLAMIGLAAEAKSTFLFPIVFGVSTALPVLVFVGILAFQAKWLGKAFNIVGKIDRWSRMVTGTLFVLIGIWFSLRYNFELF